MTPPAKKAAKKAVPKTTKKAKATKKSVAKSTAKKSATKATRKAPAKRPAKKASSSSRKAPAKNRQPGKSGIDLAAVVELQETPHLERAIKRMSESGHPQTEAIDILATQIYAFRQGQETNTRALVQIIGRLEALEAAQADRTVVLGKRAQSRS